MTWRRSDLTPAGLGRALVTREPRLCLSRFGESWVLTDPLARSTVGTLAMVLDVIRDRGVPMPLDRDLAWLDAP